MTLLMVEAPGLERLIEALGRTAVLAGALRPQLQEANSSAARFPGVSVSRTAILDPGGDGVFRLEVGGGGAVTARAGPNQIPASRRSPRSSTAGCQATPP